VTDSPIQHPAFPQPADPHAVIWRYMDIAKFADIVSHGRLYMPRADLLGDEHEGTTPAAELEYWRHLIENAETEEERRIIQGNREQLAEFARDYGAMILGLLRIHMPPHHAFGSYEQDRPDS
jgi:hypothetical protein